MSYNFGKLVSESPPLSLYQALRVSRAHPVTDGLLRRPTSDPSDAPQHRLRVTPMFTAYDIHHTMALVAILLVLKLKDFKACGLFMMDQTEVSDLYNECFEHMGIAHWNDPELANPCSDSESGSDTMIFERPDYAKACDTLGALLSIPTPRLGSLDRWTPKVHFCT